MGFSEGDERNGNGRKNPCSGEHDGKLHNPGSIGDILKEFRQSFPIFQEGTYLVYNNCLNLNFQTSHSLKILPNANTQCGYRFGATYALCRHPNDIKNSNRTVLCGDIFNSGLRATIEAKHNNEARLRGQFITEYVWNKVGNNQFTTDYFGDTYTLSLGIINTSFKKVSGFIVGQYLQSITNHLSLGVEYTHKYGKLYDNASLCNIITKFEKNGNLLAVNVGKDGVHILAQKKINEEIKLGLELTTNVNKRCGTGLIGYQYDRPKNETTFRGSIDTNWNVYSVMEKRLKPFPCTFSLHAILNQKSGNFKTGVGFVIG